MTMRPGMLFPNIIFCEEEAVHLCEEVPIGAVHYKAICSNVNSDVHTSCKR